MPDDVVAESAGKIFGKLRAKGDEVKTWSDNAQRRRGYQPAKTDAPTMGVDKVSPSAKFGDRPGEKRIDVKDMVKPLAGNTMPSYKDGVKRVPKTGPAMLHKGEAVIPKEVNDIVLGAKQLPNPKGITPLMDTDAPPVKPLSGSHMDISNPVKNEMEPSEMRSYKKGTASVPKTGPAMLHEGEAVIPAKDNKMDKSVMDKITGGVPAKVISHMVHRKHKADHHVVENHHTRPEHHPVEHHHFKGADAMDQVHAHMEEHAGEMNPGEAEADSGQHGIPEGTPGAPPVLPAGAPAGAAPAVGA